LFSYQFLPELATYKTSLFNEQLLTTACHYRAGHSQWERDSQKPKTDNHHLGQPESNYQSPKRTSKIQQSALDNWHITTSNKKISLTPPHKKTNNLQLIGGSQQLEKTHQNTPNKF
jgi:hypothetical protein